MDKMYGVRFGEQHSYTDLGLILNSKSIGVPSPKTNTIDIPGADGEIDLTEALTGDIKYSNRIIKCELTHKGDYGGFLTKWSELQNLLHGKKMKIVFDDDTYYYYIGRVTLNEWKTDKAIGRINLQIDAEPYKQETQTSAEDWIWDIFNFETGVIRELKDITIVGTKEVTIIGSSKKSIPVIYSTSQMKIKYRNNTYDIVAGTNKIYDILLPQGTNKLTFIGNGVITIEYRGGSL